MELDWPQAKKKLRCHRGDCVGLESSEKEEKGMKITL